jgi:SagB-type dehydrogenase family enzyme
MQQAKNLGDTLTRDPQMQLPVYPRLSEDFVKVWADQRTFVAFGGLGNVVLRGKSVESLLPQLLPLLTGRLSLDEIITRVQGFQPGAVRDAVSLLFMQGLLEEGQILDKTITREMIRDFRSQLKFYSRYIDFTRAFHNRYDVLAGLQKSSVLLLAAGEAPFQALGETISLGLGRLTVLTLDGNNSRWERLNSLYARVQLLDVDAVALEKEDPDAVAALVEAMSVHDLTLLVSDQPCLRLTRLLNRLAIGHKKPFLRSFISENEVEIGPAVFAGQSACYECLHLAGLLDLEAPEPAPGQTGASKGTFSPEEQIGAGHTSLFTLALLTKFIPIKTGDTIYRLMDDVLALKGEAAYQLAGCPACSGVRGYEAGRHLQVGPEHGENWPLLYHLNTNERAYNLFPKGHQMHYSPKNMKTVQGAYKQYRNRETLELRPLTLEMLPQQFQTSYAACLGTAVSGNHHLGPINLAQIGFLMQVVGGFQTIEGGIGWNVGLRLTPSAGGMASQTLYLVNFAVEELPAGIYHFNPRDRTLDKLRQGHFERQLQGCLAGAGEPVTGAIAAVIQTAAHGRIESKYVSKSYRYVHYDGGAMLHSLQIAGHLMGLELWQTADFYDDELNELLGIRTTTEFAVAVAYLTRPAVEESQA